MPFQPGHEGYLEELTEEHRKKISEAHKRTYENGRIPYFQGRHLSEEHKHNLSIAKKEYYKTHEHPAKGRKLTVVLAYIGDNIAYQHG